MKKILTVMFAVLLISAPAVSVSAVEYDYKDDPYKTYTYDSNNNPLAIPSAFSYKGKITGEDINGVKFGELADIFYSKEEDKIYITDSASNQIVVLKSDYSPDKILSDFANGEHTDKFNAPKGICVRDGIIYVADSENSRIVTFDSATYEFKKIFTKPQIKQLGDNYTYKPIKLAVGISGQMYVIAQSINSGFIVLDSEGVFEAFVGAPKVKTNFIDEIWKLFMTKAQKENMLKNVPTEYNSVAFDDEGFLYATTQSLDVQPIIRLNLQGTDISSYEEDYPQGDGLYQNNISTFIDVCADNSGNYFALDSNSGRVFAYNSSGELLFAFGVKGTQSGALTSPVALELIGDRLLIADAVTGIINIYDITSFGSNIIKANALVNEGEYGAAKKLWQEVKNRCSSYNLATDSLGKIALYERDYKKAMFYFISAGDKTGYSDAFRYYRTDLIYENYLYIALTLLLIAVSAVVYKKLILKSCLAEKFRNSKLGKGNSYARYCAFHPFDGFWCLKREQKGNMLTANVTVLCFFIVYLLNVQFSGYLFIDGKREDINALLSLLSIAAVMVCYCLANWCFTSLMDGKGTLKEIYIALTAAVRPYIFGGLALFALSWVLSAEEMFIYTTVKSFLLIWIFSLLFIGMIMTHDYSPVKGIATLVLTLIGMALIMFIALFITNLIEDIIDYINDIYRELLYRNL